MLDLELKHLVSVLNAADSLVNQVDSESVDLGELVKVQKSFRRFQSRVRDLQGLMGRDVSAARRTAERMQADISVIRDANAKALSALATQLMDAIVQRQYFGEVDASKAQLTINRLERLDASSLDTDTYYQMVSRPYLELKKLDEAVTQENLNAMLYAVIFLFVFVTAQVKKPAKWDQAGCCELGVGMDEAVGMGIKGILLKAS